MRIRNPIGIEYERVSGVKYALDHRAVPFPKESQHRAGGVELVDRTVAMEEQPRQVPAVRIAQPSQLIVVLCKEERSVGALAGVFVK